MSDGPWGMYVHVPWCRAHCPYCAFYVVAGPEAPPDAAFVRAIIAEHAHWAPMFPGPAATLYLGGGTPSRLPPHALERLVTGVPLAAGAEVTAEANPEDLTEVWLAGAMAAGIDRISLGVQSFAEPEARRLGRAHSARQAEEACRRLAEAPIRSWSVDLMFAIPGQDLRRLDADLDRVLDLGAPHVSVYGLTIEPGTRFERARARGNLPDVPDDTWRAMYDRVVGRLEGAGIARYEVSNFARPGHESAHNQLYWSDRPYMGLGPAAHGYAPDGGRWANPADLARWLEHGASLAQMSRPTPREAAADLLISGMRGVQGVDRARLRRRTGHDVGQDTVRHLERGRLLHAREDRLALTEHGFPVADGVVARLIDALSDVAGSASGGPGPTG